ncbi:MAG: hypothetical protein JW741_27515 [Sedimentisphaerales bacterium]|nr:hypothetical protein [Sedimentisphaerales bacterium]
MAGMFYSLTEAAAKLGQTEDEVKQLAKEGKLREFRDGSNLLFKIEEVDALLGGAEPEVVDLDAELEATAPDEALAEIAEPEFEAEPTAEMPLEEEILDLEPEMEIAPELEPAAEGTAEFDLTEEQLPEPPAADIEIEPEAVELEAVGEAEGTSELGFAPEATGTTAEEEALVLDEDEIPAEPLAEGTEEEIFLAPESGILGAESDITDMDTALTGEGVSVLGGTDTGYDVTEDSMAETVGPAGTSTEASLEEIEDDVNLDSFGSGSGLLDLSLQADDTSLGGILDEIYTAEGGEEGVPGEDSGTVEDMTAEAEHGVPEEGLAAPEPVAMAMGPAVGAAAFVEAPPDTQSNMLGMMLFLPLAALLYAAIVTVAAQRQVMPSILESVQGLIWFIMGGAVVVAAIIVGASFAMGGEKTRAPKAKKAKKGKKEKAPKEKKAKAPKPKKEKKPKAEKPKKEKKPFLGKKKAK